MVFIIDFLKAINLGCVYLYRSEKEIVKLNSFLLLYVFVCPKSKVKITYITMSWILCGTSSSQFYFTRILDGKMMEVKCINIL